MFDTIGDIPMHPLIVHGVVVLVPLAALLLAAAALSTRVRARAGLLTPLTATAALALVPLATQSGEALEDRVGESPLVEVHSDLGESLIWFTLALAIAAWVLWALDRRTHSSAVAQSPPAADAGSGTAAGRSPLMLVVSALCVVAALATTVQVVRIGHSGASATWQGVGQQVVVDTDDDN